MIHHENWLPKHFDLFEISFLDFITCLLLVRNELLFFRIRVDFCQDLKDAFGLVLQTRGQATTSQQRAPIRQRIGSNPDCFASSPASC